jgi:XTP/dITP diphosphohydrolase
MIDLVFATNNKNKLQEVSSVLAGKICLSSLSDIGCYDDIPETGHTFHENASQKSHYIVDRYHKNCFADDSGLEVEALNNEPGVYSARYSGSRDMEENMALLLKNLQDVSNRKAAFVTVISLIFDGKEYFFEGRVSGEIIESKRGNQGFGYDPLFLPDGYDKTFAEMDEAEKNAISHRAIAVKKLIDFLLSL